MYANPRAVDLSVATRMQLFASQHGHHAAVVKLLTPAGGGWGVLVGIPYSHDTLGEGTELCIAGSRQELLDVLGY